MNFINKIFGREQPTKQITLAQKRKAVVEILTICKQVKPDLVFTKQCNDKFLKIDPLDYTDKEVILIFDSLKSIMPEMEAAGKFRAIVSDKNNKLFIAGGWEQSKTETSGNIITMAKGTLKLIIDSKAKTFKVVDNGTVKVSTSPIDALEEYLTKPLTQFPGSL